MLAQAQILEELSLFRLTSGGLGSWITPSTDLEVFACLGRIDEVPLTRAQLNQLLAYAHEAPLSEPFYSYYWLWAIHLTGAGDFAPWPIWRRPVQGWRVPSSFRRGWGHGLGVSGPDEILIPHRPVNHSQFQDPIEQHSSAPGVATVE